MFRDRAEERIKEIDEEIESLKQEFDYQDACDPNIETPDDEMELFWEVEELLQERSQLQKLIDSRQV